MAKLEELRNKFIDAHYCSDTQAESCDFRCDDCKEFFSDSLNRLENKIRADERHKFAEWCKTKGYGCYDWQMLIEQYEKEQTNG